MHLYDLIPENELNEALYNGLVRAQHHPTEPYRIYNYTDKAQIHHVWNRATRACRGLIVDTRTHEIVARPFPKFFNHGEEKNPRWRSDETVLVTDKMDGSLGILYPLTAGGYAIATRGSFTSEQALHATEVWNECYAERYEPMPGKTVLFEIIYPENRIVVDYGNQDDLVVLGMVDIETGLSFGPGAAYWPGSEAAVFRYFTLRDALAAPPRPGAEGLVVHFLDSDERVKIKQADYVRLHKIVTGLNERVIWDYLGTHDETDELFAGLPDEYFDWVTSVIERLTLDAGAMVCVVLDRWDELARAGLVLGPRKDFALAIERDAPWLRWCLFALLDGRDYSQIIWKQLRPDTEHRPARPRTEAARAW
ncbi:RNA ligase [Amycolatopsis minnesotensis]|uniref:T4 RNA ligase 1-like N-terminal domain-containing protein n=1 Tax=Amycolatopsis minnesotensis TaxID=337894 RepID=A0ABN2Q2W5_9PSEU